MGGSLYPKAQVEGALDMVLDGSRTEEAEPLGFREDAEKGGVGAVGERGWPRPGPGGSQRVRSAS